MTNIYYIFAYSSHSQASNHVQEPMEYLEYHICAYATQGKVRDVQIAVPAGGVRFVVTPYSHGNLYPTLGQH